MSICITIIYFCSLLYYIIHVDEASNLPPYPNFYVLIYPVNTTVQHTVTTTTTLHLITSKTTLDHMLKLVGKFNDLFVFYSIIKYLCLLLAFMSDRPPIANAIMVRNLISTPWKNPDLSLLYTYTIILHIT